MPDPDILNRWSDSKVAANITDALSTEYMLKPILVYGLPEAIPHVNKLITKGYIRPRVYFPGQVIPGLNFHVDATLSSAFVRISSIERNSPSLHYKRVE